MPKGIDPNLQRELSRIGRELYEHSQRLNSMERTSQGKYRSVTGGNTTYYDFGGNPQVIVGPQSDGTSTVTHQNGVIPEVPSLPIVTPGVESVEVKWDGLDQNGNANWLSDFSHIEVHLSDNPDFTAVDATQRASFHSRLGGAATLVVPPGGGHYVAFVAVNKALQESDRTVEVEAVAGVAQIPELVTLQTETIPNLLDELANVGNHFPIGADDIDNQAVRVDKLTIGSVTDSLIPNGNFEDWEPDDSKPILWRFEADIDTTGAVYGKAVDGDAISGNSSVTLRAANGAVATLSSETRIPVVPTIGSNKYYIGVTAKAAGPYFNGLKVGAYYYANDDTFITSSWSTYQTIPGTAPYYHIATVPATAALMEVWVQTGEGAATYTVTVDDFEVRRLVGGAFIAEASILTANIADANITNAKISDLSASKITTDFLAADVKIRAGVSETGARAEMTPAGFQGYNSSNAQTFGILAATGTAVIGAPGAFPRIHLSVEEFVDPNRGTQNWALQQYHVASGWNPGSVWGSSFTESGSWGALRLQAPYVGSNALISAHLDLRTRSDGHSRALVRASLVEFSAGTMVFSSNGGSMDLNLSGLATNTWSFRNGGGQRINLAYATGYNILSSGGPVNQPYALLYAADNHVFTLDGTTEGIYMHKSTSNARAVIGGTGGTVFSSIAFIDDRVRACTWNAQVLMPIEASNLLIPSDMMHKTNEEPVSNALDDIMTMTVYDYDTPFGAAEDATAHTEFLKTATHEDLENFRYRQRGVIAQDLQAAVPHAVSEDDIGLSVDLYGLLSTTIAALQELKSEVNDLREELGK